MRVRARVVRQVWCPITSLEVPCLIPRHIIILRCMYQLPGITFWGHSAGLTAFLVCCMAGTSASLPCLSWAAVGGTKGTVIIILNESCFLIVKTNSKHFYLYIVKSLTLYFFNFKSCKWWNYTKPNSYVLIMFE